MADLQKKVKKYFEVTDTFKKKKELSRKAKAESNRKAKDLSVAQTRLKEQLAKTANPKQRQHLITEFFKTMKELDSTLSTTDTIALDSAINLLQGQDLLGRFNRDNADLIIKGLLAAPNKGMISLPSFITNVSEVIPYHIQGHVQALNPAEIKESLTHLVSLYTMHYISSGKN